MANLKIDHLGIAVPSLAEAARAFSNSDAREKLARIGMDPVAATPEEFVSFLRAEIAKWSRVVKEANIRIE